MKKLTLKLLIIAGILSVIGVGIGIGGFAMMGFSTEGFGVREVGPSIEKTYAMQEVSVSKIDVQLKQKNIELKSTDKDEIKILGQGNIDFNVSNEAVLSIKEKESPIKDNRWYRLMRWDDFSNQNLIIEIPKSFMGDIALSNDYGKITAKDLNAINSLSCDSKESPDIALNYLEIKNDLKLITSYGDIKLSSIKAGKGSVIENKEGSLEIEESMLEELSINKTYSEINLKNLTGNSLNVLSKESTLSFENIAVKEINMETDYGNIDFSELSSELIQLKTLVGDISGSIKGKMAEYKISAVSKEGENNLETKFNGDKELYVEALGNIDISFSEH